MQQKSQKSGIIYNCQQFLKHTNRNPPNPVIQKVYNDFSLALPLIQVYNINTQYTEHL